MSKTNTWENHRRRQVSSNGPNQDKSVLKITELLLKCRHLEFTVHLALRTFKSKLNLFVLILFDRCYILTEKNSQIATDSKSEEIGGILRKIKSEIEKSLPTHERQGPIPISRHERRSREWLEIGIGPCLE